ncbi:MAG: xanthine dehydrogenase family protein subunit M [Roseitalea sp.]|jgi:carbon-monoxide dehydrogenase medium subunit|uniref:FAD binding domain-containing protein n=1 Tax=Oceaniradius stylonematis TaxID=2184161 RepID=UPI000F3B52F5|nr:xanthine dehydrogenase family protein subunit M [Oceaniradius stylonematis]MBO6553717.1 xanthine dehydrogenase family protein subunit M [Roseitalea sp.]MBO6952760.1 xanthine dehydrogenase family protein subunit M [Rhizobiaceae bacterium]RNC96450.1 MAG: xanthine dehydrogenase family protein subunit M [Oricola sp.]MBO6592753.1 xanthine dehydrogenase family protein subunit M [Roseitalea sp.]MBO6600504.1 xanthine dehydrogenase family protein subunit M [Roseitalea sp.]
MYAVNYHKPASIEDAVAAIGGADEAKILAGGQTLLPTMKQHLAAPSDVIDIRGIGGMTDIAVRGDTVTIGAAATHAAVAGSNEVGSVCPALAALAAGIGDPAVRHMGTIGGSIANNDPAADYPAGLLALGATIVTNNREIAADEFFTGMFTTALEDGEIITAVNVSAPGKAAYAKFRNPASRYAMVGVFVAKTGDGARVAVTGAGEDGVFRHDGLEQALGTNWSPDAVDAVAVSADGLMSDIHASADYRAHLIKVMAKRAVAAAG